MKILLILLLLGCSVQAQVPPRYDTPDAIEWYESLTDAEKKVEDDAVEAARLYRIRDEEIEIRNVAIKTRREGIINFYAAWNKSFHNSNYKNGFRKRILRERDDVKAFARMDKLEAEDAKYQQSIVVFNRKKRREKARPNYRKWIEAKLNNDQAALDAFQVKWDAFKQAHP